MKSRALPVLGLLLLLGAGAFATRSLWMPRPPNVILVVIDTLRADHLSAWGHERATSPVIDAFAAENLKFEHAISTAPWTAPSVASIFTGLYPTAHGVLGHTEPPPEPEPTPSQEAAAQEASVREGEPDGTATSPDGTEASPDGPKGGPDGAEGESDSAVAQPADAYEADKLEAAPPAEHDVAMSVLHEGLETTAEALKGRGYRTAGVTANAWVAEYLGFAQGFDTFETHDYERAQAVNERALALLDGLQTTDDPFFLYLQYMDPHAPYNPPPEDMEGMSGRNTKRPYKGRFISRSNRYDGEIHYVDRKLGELFDELKRRELYEDAVIVVVSDHGEQFGERGHGGHGSTLRHWETHVPLIVKAGERQGVISTPVSIADVHPTILALAGVEEPRPVQAMSLIDTDLKLRGGVLAEATRGRNHKAIVAPNQHKLILNFKGTRRDVIDRSQERRVLAHFNVQTDPREQKKLRKPVLEGKLKDAFYALYEDSVTQRVEAQDQALTPETIEQLKALGYLD